MSNLPTHSFRWQHRTHARPTGHWHVAEKGNTRYDRYVLGSVEDCPDCNGGRDE